MSISRRALITKWLPSSMVLACIPYSFYKFKTGKASEIVVSILERRLGYLHFEDGAFEAYAKEYLQFRKQYQSELAKLAVVALPMRYVTPYEFLSNDHLLVRLEDNVVSNFLMSTDFFHTQMDEERVIQYQGFYDPIKRPCTNPFFVNT